MDEEKLHNSNNLKTMRETLNKFKLFSYFGSEFSIGREFKFSTILYRL